jgi:hypothetical protein
MANKWERDVSNQKAKHAALNAPIVATETAPKAGVYQVFALTVEEIGLIEGMTNVYPGLSKIAS